MPIYEYVCHACGLEKEHLQKLSDAPIAHCPACGSTEYIKKVSAASFRLKGSGWYVTDFKDKKGSSAETESKSNKEIAGKEAAANTDSSTHQATTDTKNAASSASTTPSSTSSTPN